MNLASDKNKKWYSTTEMAKVANVTSGYLRRLLIAGRIKGEKIASNWVITAGEVQRFMDSRK